MWAEGFLERGPKLGPLRTTDCTVQYSTETCRISFGFLHARVLFKHGLRAKTCWHFIGPIPEPGSLTGVCVSPSERARTNSATLALQECDGNLNVSG